MPDIERGLLPLTRFTIFAFAFASLLAIDSVRCAHAAPGPLPQRRYFLVDIAVISDTDPLGPAAETYAAINDRGDVVGSRDGLRAFMWSAGAIVSLPDNPPWDQISDRPFGSTARAVNNAREVAGSCGRDFPVFMTGLPDFSPALWINGKPQVIPDGDLGWASAVNDSGVVAGTAYYRGFVFTKGKSATLRPLSTLPEGNGTDAEAINAAGIVAGASTVDGRSRGAPPVHACVWKPSARGYRPVDVGKKLAPFNSIATCIDARGDIAGFTGRDANAKPVAVSGEMRAFCVLGGRLLRLSAPGNRGESEADAMNDAGEVVGIANGRAALWRKGRYVDLNAATIAAGDWLLTEAYGINRRGQIVAVAERQGKRHLVLLTPR